MPLQKTRQGMYKSIRIFHLFIFSWSFLLPICNYPATMLVIYAEWHVPGTSKTLFNYFSAQMKDNYDSTFARHQRYFQRRADVCMWLLVRSTGKGEPWPTTERASSVYGQQAAPGYIPFCWKKSLLTRALANFTYFMPFTATEKKISRQAATEMSKVLCIY